MMLFFMIAEFQSTPPHGRRQYRLFRSAYRKGVSIHASAREATSIRCSELLAPPVSIHASAREATRMPRSILCQLSVSIHASAREATERCL